MANMPNVLYSRNLLYEYFNIVNFVNWKTLANIKTIGLILFGHVAHVLLVMFERILLMAIVSQCVGGSKKPPGWITQLSPSA